MSFVFLHGAGCTRDVWASQLAAFPDAFAPNLPGHTTPGEPASISDFADAVGADLDARGIEDAVLCGNSMGGAVALELVLRRHPRVRALVMLSSGAKLRVSPALLEAMTDNFLPWTSTVAGFFYASPTPEQLAASVAMMVSVGAQQTIRDFRACDAFNAVDRLAEVSVPALALVGDRDVMTPPKLSEFLADRIPGAVSRILTGAGHLAMIERPDETNAALRAFATQIGS